MTHLHSEIVTAGFQWELYPASGYDSLPATIYRVGSAIEPYDAHRRLSEAEEEALTARWIPRTATAQRRYLAAAAIEEPKDLQLPPHRRPALVRALAIARVMTGGLLVERREDLGDVLGRAAVLKLALGSAGMPDLRQFDTKALHGDVPATFTIGFLGKSRGRRSALREDHALLARHVAEIHAEVRRAEQYDATGVVHECEQLMEAVSTVKVLDGDIAWGEPGTRSEFFPDLSYVGAQSYVARLAELGSPDEQIAHMLGLFGFLNSKGHRVWHRAELRRLPDGIGRG